MKNTVFTGAGVAIVTPMNKDMSINYEKLGKLIDWQIAQGTDAIVICGTTGESSTMTDDEHMHAIKFAVEQTDGRVPVVAGTGSNDTSYAIWLSKEAEKLGADALLHVTPYYNKTSQRGLIKHYTAIAESTKLPIIVYNVPSRTGVTVKPETYFELSKIPNIVAAKEASGNLSAIAKTRALCGDNLDIYSGNDDQIVPIMALGGKGVISVLSNIMPKETHEICTYMLHQKVNKAQQLALNLLDVTNALFSDVNPIPVKEALNLMGKNVGECRLPLVSMEDSAKVALRDKMRKVGLI